MDACDIFALASSGGQGWDFQHEVGLGTVFRVGSRALRDSYSQLGSGASPPYDKFVGATSHEIDTSRSLSLHLLHMQAYPALFQPSKYRLLA